MVNVYIFSQKQFNKIMKDMSWYDDTIDMITDTAIVSICNTDKSMIHWFADKHNNVLNLDFDDVLFTDEEAGIFALNDEQAKILVDFFEEHKDVQNFIVHCEAGISRSAAVAVCFVDFLHMNGKKDITLHKNYAFSPNPLVERLLHREFVNRNTDTI